MKLPELRIDIGLRGLKSPNRLFAAVFVDDNDGLIEKVSRARDGHNVVGNSRIIFENATQVEDMLRQVRLLDRLTWPDLAHDLVFSDYLT